MLRYKMMNNDYYLLYLFENPLEGDAVYVSALVMPPRQANLPSMRRVFHGAYTTVAGNMAAASAAPQKSGEAAAVSKPEGSGKVIAVRAPAAASK